MPRAPTITSPYVPDLGQVRAWLEKMIASLSLVELVVAVMALITRMRDINAELTKQLAHLRRKHSWPAAPTPKRRGSWITV